MTSTWGLAVAGARAHRAALSGAGLTLAAAGAVLAMIGVLLETGLRGGPGVDGATLTLLASSYAGTALVVVVLVVASTMTLALRSRRREFALLRTVGATRGQVRSQVSREVLLVALAAAPVGAVLGTVGSAWLTPLLTDGGFLRSGAQLSLSPLPAVAALIVLLPTALLGGWLAARETVSISPTEAVRQSVAEEQGIGRVRRVLALVTAAAGLSAALTPLFVPGTIGGATAASSAFLLVGAAALGGPLLVRWAFRHAAGLVRARGGPEVRLAVLNLLGYSRRLTIVVVPLALALSTGTIETTVDRTIAEAAEQQLSDTVRADLVVTSTTTQEQLARMVTVPGVTAVVPLADVPVQVRTDQEDGPDSLIWERSSLRTVPPQAPTELFDPGVTTGALAALDQPGTVALSSDAAFLIGLGVGESLSVRVGGEEFRLPVVAVYEHGLGVGDYLTGPATLRELGAQVDPSAVLLRSTDPAGATEAIRGLGLTVDTPEHYIATATDAAAAQQRVSSVLVLLLLIFVGIAAADALVLSTTSRRAELTLLNRIGTTRPQLLRMAAVEALITALLAWIIGTASILPAVLAVSGALLGRAPPVVDLPVYGLLSAAVLVTALGATLVPAAVVSRVWRAPAVSR